MTQEDKELLLKDLCARLPYEVYVKDIRQGTKVCKIYEIKPSYIRSLTLIPIPDSYYYQAYSCDIDSVRPYLRPMSSMTEEEISDLQKINCQFCFDKFDNFAYVGAADDGFCSVEEMDNILNYLNSKHFDYRGLIEKGLAIEAPKEMYDIKEK